MQGPGHGGHGDLQAPFQLGYRTPHIAEVAVHAAQPFLHNLHPGQLILKLDFKNAFNTIQHEKMLLVVKEKAPDIYVHSAYSAYSSLFFGGKTLQSAEGIQSETPHDLLIVLTYILY